MPFELMEPTAQVVDEEFSMWQNNRYVVLKRRVKADEASWPALIHLSIRRLDRLPIKDWRDLQRIKNELVGLECEGIELYPAESRLVDMSNQFHLFVIERPGMRFPFGYKERSVSEATYDGSKQRPFEEKPSDLIGQADMEKLIREREKRLLDAGYVPVRGPN
jgi:hypothetical protein